jgi:hypothetical protein
MTSDQIWQTALGELQLQLTGATFDTWLKRTNLIASEDGMFVIGVHNGYAKDWLEHRLLSMIKRTLTNIVGHSVEVRFAVWNKEIEAGEGGPLLQSKSPDSLSAPALPEPEGDVEEFVLPDFDTREAGWQHLTHYDLLFWYPYLGRIGWRVWAIVRATDKRKEKDEWTPPKRWTAPAMSDLVPCSKQMLLGVNRRCKEITPGAQLLDGVWVVRTRGAFETLVEEAVARIEKRGNPPRFTYWISVLVKLPLLRPDQIARLPAALQVKHDQWLDDHGLDATKWDYEQSLEKVRFGEFSPVNR